VFLDARPKQSGYGAKRRAKIIPFIFGLFSFLYRANIAAAIGQYVR
jgi:hypothetical protein